MIPILSIVGRSDSGKTTLLERLISELKARGYRIATIKHDVHGFDIDHEGKDSWRLKRAGSDVVIISSPAKIALIKDVQREETLEEIRRSYLTEVDIILTEGYKRERYPKIEVFRSGTGDEPLCSHEDNLIAIVSDRPILHLGVPWVEINDILSLVKLIEERILKGVKDDDRDNIGGWKEPSHRTG